MANVSNVTKKEIITLHVLGLSDMATDCKVFKHRTLKRLMDVYSNRIGLGRDEVVFSFNGVTIADGDTPLSLQMVDGDTIHISKHADVEDSGK